MRAISFLLIFLLSLSLKADYYKIQGKGDRIYIYKSANAGGPSGKKTKNYHGVYGDLYIRNLRYISDQGEFYKVSFFDDRNKTTKQGYVIASKVRKVLIKEAKTKEEIQAERKASPNLTLSINSDILKVLRKSFGLKNTKEFSEFLTQLPEYTQNYQNHIENEYQSLARAEANVSKLTPQHEEADQKHSELSSGLETSQNNVTKLTKQKTELTATQTAHKETIETITEETQEVVKKKENEVKAAKKQGYIWSAIAAILGLFIGTKFIRI